jgi:hypothetical protein
MSTFNRLDLESLGSSTDPAQKLPGTDPEPASFLLHGPEPCPGLWAVDGPGGAPMAWIGSALWGHGAPH